jgi:uncharacterized protein YndB with AHSA1/START domain
MGTTSHEATIDVEATREEVWDALTNPQKTRGYYYGTDILSDWQPGSRWTSESGDELYLEGELIEVDAPNRIVQTFHVAIEEPAASDAPSRVTWELTDLGDGATRLRMLHEGMGQATRNYVEGGWEHILAGLKSVVESGTVPDQTMDTTALVESA